MRLRRKATTPEPEQADAGLAAEESAAVTGPFDLADSGIDLDDPDLDLLDLGGLLVPPPPEGYELQLQIDEQTDAVQAVLYAGAEGALELRVFAAGRNTTLWPEVREQMSAEAVEAGGTAQEREGDFGPEITLVVPVTTPDGQQAAQPSRLIGVDGERWFLRAMLLGRPAVEPETATDLENLIRTTVIRRGNEAKPRGEALELHLPAHVHREA